MKECGPDGVIDDFEDNNNQISVIGERGGYWYTYADNKGSTVFPLPGDQGGVFNPVEGGHDSKFAVEVKGKLAQNSIVYAAMGLNFQDPKGPYDASIYEGITFWAKRAPGTINKLVVKLPDGNTDPDGQACSACLQRLRLHDHRRRAVGPLRAAVPRSAAGAGLGRAAQAARRSASSIFAIHFEAKVPGGDYDFFVDDIAFVCKG